MECKDFEPSIIQDNQILKLYRRLSKFSLEQIVLISELEETGVLPILREFISEGKISETNGQYYYCKQVSVMQKYLIFSYYNSMIIDTIIRCFCSGCIHCGTNRKYR